jgi:hypothetical protein
VVAAGAYAKPLAAGLGLERLERVVVAVQHFFVVCEQAHLFVAVGLRNKTIKGRWQRRILLRPVDLHQT